MSLVVTGHEKGEGEGEGREGRGRRGRGAEGRGGERRGGEGRGGEIHTSIHHTHTHMHCAVTALVSSSHVLLAPSTPPHRAARPSPYSRARDAL